MSRSFNASDRKPSRWLLIALLALVLLAIWWWRSGMSSGPDSTLDGGAAAEIGAGGTLAEPDFPDVQVGVAPELQRVEVLDTREHDPAAFTQGLILHEGSLFESTGLRGRSSLREVDPDTGSVLRQIEIDAEYFAEGLERVDDRLIQLTWQSGTAFEYDLDSFAEIGRFEYETEGWGLCYDGERLVMSDGSSTLFFRDSETFALEGQIEVTLAGQPIDQLNELECVGDAVFANVWQTDTILRIDPNTGAVGARIDASGLLTTEEQAAADVLNGIVYDPETGHFLITGKLWPRLFEVRFVAATMEEEN